MNNNKLIVEFEKTLQNTENKLFLIENEIKELDLFIKSDSIHHDSDSFVSSNPFKRNFGKKVFKLKYYSDDNLRDFFYELQLNENYQFNIENHHGNKYIEATFYNAVELAIYHKYLKGLLNNSSKKPKQSNSDLTHKQKMLALHYLGLDLSKNENTSSAKILSQILDLDYDNTRKYLSYVSSGKNQVRTKTNLQKIQKLFENQNFNEISSKIKEDIEKL